MRDTLFNNRIRFAQLPELNDPFEGRPFLVPQHEDLAKQWATIYAAVLDDAHREGLSGEAAERNAKFETNVMVDPRVPRHLYQKGLVESIHENFWVYSVSATRDPILLWSHYADGHKGLALHFDARVVPFDRPFRVHYSNVYPYYRFPAAQDPAASKSAKAMLYTKSRGWVYEKEYRVIRVLAPGIDEQLAWRGTGVQWDGQFATLAEDALSGITLGAAMSDEFADELIAEIAERRPKLEVWRAGANERSYALNFQKVR